MCKNLFYLCFVGLFILSCESDDSPIVITEIGPNVTENSLEMDYGTTEVLSTPNNELATWYLGDSLITESTTYEFNGDTAGNYTVSSIYQSEAQTDSVVYNIHVFGQFAEGVLVVNGSSEDLNRSTVTFIANDSTIINNAFNLVNNTYLSEGMISANVSDNDIFMISQNGPNFITQVDRETLLLERTITDSEASSPSYINFYNDQAVIVNADTDDRAAYLWNINEDNIFTAGLSDLDDVPAIQSFALAINDELLLVNGNKVYRYQDGNAEVFYTAEGFVSGVLPDGDNGFYIATQAIQDIPAKFIHYDNNFNVIATIEVDDAYSVPRNGNIIASGGSFYWQETSLGTLIKYDLANETFSDLGYPFNYGIYFTTVIKENPFTHEIYIGGLSDFTTSEGVVAQLSAEGELINTYENIGYTPVDFIFNDKQLFR